MFTFTSLQQDLYDFAPDSHSVINHFDAHNMGTAIKHPVPDRVKPSFVILTSRHSYAQG